VDTPDHSAGASIDCRPWQSADGTHTIEGKGPGSPGSDGTSGQRARTGTDRATC
jgi:hypothetical protein